MSQYEYVNIFYFFNFFNKRKFFNLKFGHFTPHKLGL